uniref:GFA family protein n=1 Tax=Kangsaoukella pontilimi TaxID=2691042 RepID=UPI00387311E9
MRFLISGAFESFFLCHCSRCRKDSGSAHSANLFSSKAEIEWLAGLDHVRTFQLPSTRHVKSFCSACGSAVPMLQADKALLVVPAGSLDSRLDIRPDARICYASRAEWTDQLAPVPTVDGLPG